jgi:hypothetical protein
MASSGSVKQLISDLQNRPDFGVRFQEAALLQKSSGEIVQRLTRGIEERNLESVTLQQEVDAALQGAVSDVRGAGHQVTQAMIETAKHLSDPSKSIAMQEQMRKYLLREVAVASALKEFSQGANDISNKWDSTWVKEGEARLAASKAGSDYDAMFDSALRALSIDQFVYVVVVNQYSAIGVNLDLSLASLGEEFRMEVSRDATVADVAFFVQQERLQKQPAGPGKKIEVKVVGPGGTVLPRSQLIKNALDVEGEDLLDDEKSVYYPLSVLTGRQWKDLGLHAPTRWKHLRESEFSELFGMTKSAFEKLPDWKQTPLKKKHGLF